MTAPILPDGTVLVTTYHSIHLYDPRTEEFNRIGLLWNGRGAGTVTLLPSGHVLIAGGADKRGNKGNPVWDRVLNTAHLYDPGYYKKWSRTQLTTSRSEHTATLLPPRNVLLTGGTDESGKVLRSAELLTWSRSSPIPTPTLTRIFALTPAPTRKATATPTPEEQPDIICFAGTRGCPDSGEVHLAAELELMQTAMNAMMADNSLTTVVEHTSGAAVNAWTALPAAAGGAPLAVYLKRTLTRHYYCWDARGNVYPRSDDPDVAKKPGECPQKP